jgi:hypothetical protein
MSNKELIDLLRQAADALESAELNIRPINTANKLSDRRKGIPGLTVTFGQPRKVETVQTVFSTQPRPIPPGSVIG